jgi:hypothetical protein
MNFPHGPLMTSGYTPPGVSPVAHRKASANGRQPGAGKRRGRRLQPSARLPRSPFAALKEKPWKT